MASPGVRRAGHVQVPVQGHDNMTVTCAGTQLYTRVSRSSAKARTGRGA